jgi:hypothetical protein
MAYQIWQINKGGKTNPMREPMLLLYLAVTATLLLAVIIRMAAAA